MNLRKIAVPLLIVLNFVTAIPAAHSQQGNLRGPKNTTPRYVQPPQQQQPQQQQQQSPQQRPQIQREMQSGTYGPIVSSDTLWQISQNYRPNNSLSIYQVMQAIYELNPAAFDLQNINKLKDGSILRMPSESYISNINIRQAQERAERDAQNLQSDTSNKLSRQVTNAVALDQTKELLEKKLGAIDEAQNRQFIAIRKQFAESINGVQSILDENKNLFERLDKVNTDINEMRSEEVQKSLQMNQMGASIEELLEKSRQDDAEKAAILAEKETSWLDNPITLILLFTLPVFLILAGFAYWMIKRNSSVVVKIEDDDMDDLSLDPLAAEMDDLSDALSAELSGESGGELDDDNLFGDDDLLDDVLAEELEDSLDDALEDSFEESLTDGSELFDELGDDELEDEFEVGAEVVEQDDLDSLFDEDDDDLLAEVDEAISTDISDDLVDDLLAEVNDDMSANSSGDLADDLLADVQNSNDNSDLDTKFIEDDEKQVVADIDNLEHDEDDSLLAPVEADGEAITGSVLDEEEQPEISIDDVLNDSADEVIDNPFIDNSEEINEEVLQDIDKEITAQNAELDSVTGTLLDELEQVEQMRSMLPDDDDDDDEPPEAEEPQLDIQKLDGLAEGIEDDLLVDDVNEENTDDVIEIDISEVLNEPIQSAESEVLVEPAPAVEDETLVEPAPGPAVEDKALVEPVPAVEDKALVEPVPAVEDEVLDGPAPAVEAEALVEPAPAVEGEALVEPAPAVEDEKLVEPAPAVEDEALVEPAPAVEDEALVEPAPAVEAETLVEPAPAVEDEALVEPAPAVEAETLVEPAPAVEAETLVEPAPAVEAETLVEPVPAVEDEVLDESAVEDEVLDESAVEDEALVEPAPAVEDETLVEPAPAVEDEALVEPAPAVEDETLVEPAQAVEDEALVEPAPAVENEALVEPTSAVEDEVLDEPAPAVEDESSVEPAPAVEDEALVEPAPAVENEALVEPTSAVEDEVLDGPAPAVEDESSVEPAPAVKDETLVEPAPAVEDEALVEPAPAVENEALVEPTSAVEDEVLDEPAPAVEDESSVEPAPAVEDEVLVEPAPAVKDEASVEPAPAVEDEALVEPKETTETETLVDLEPQVDKIDEEDWFDTDLTADQEFDVPYNSESVLDEDQLEKALEDFENEELDEVIEDLISNAAASISSLDDLEFSADEFVTKDYISEPAPLPTLNDIESIDDFDDSELDNAFNENVDSSALESAQNNHYDLDDLPGLGDWLDEDEVKPDEKQTATSEVKNILEELEQSSFDEMLESIDLDDEISIVGEDNTGFDIAALLDETPQNKYVEVNERETEDFLDVEALLNESLSAESEDEIDKALNLEFPLEPFVNDQNNLNMIDVDADDGLGAKLDLAHAYIEIGEEESAKELLGEILNKGSAEQVAAVKTILDKLD